MRLGEPGTRYHRVLPLRNVPAAQQTLELGGLLCKLLLSSLDNHSKALFEIGLRVKIGPVLMHIICA